MGLSEEELRVLKEMEDQLPITSAVGQGPARLVVRLVRGEPTRAAPELPGHVGEPPGPMRAQPRRRHRRRRHPNLTQRARDMVRSARQKDLITKFVYTGVIAFAAMAMFILLAAIIVIVPQYGGGQRNNIQVPDPLLFGASGCGLVVGGLCALWLYWPNLRVRIRRRELPPPTVRCDGGFPGFRGGRRLAQ